MRKGGGCSAYATMRLKEKAREKKEQANHTTSMRRYESSEIALFNMQPCKTTEPAKSPVSA